MAKKTMIMVGIGPGLGMGIAAKFASEGFDLGLISRSRDKLTAHHNELSVLGGTVYSEAADAGDERALRQALRKLATQLGQVDVLEYNAVDARYKKILEESFDDLATGFKVSVAGALASVQELLADLAATKGAVIMSGGGSSLHPNSDLGTISLGKAGLRNLTQQLHSVLGPRGIYVGTVTVNGWIQPTSATHSPKILGEKFWELYRKRGEVEVVY